MYHGIAYPGSAAQGAVDWEGQKGGSKKTGDRPRSRDSFFIGTQREGCGFVMKTIVAVKLLQRDEVF